MRWHLNFVVAATPGFVLRTGPGSPNFVKKNRKSREKNHRENMFHFFSDIVDFTSSINRVHFLDIFEKLLPKIIEKISIFNFNRKTLTKLNRAASGGQAGHANYACACIYVHARIFLTG